LDIIVSTEGEYIKFTLSGSLYVNESAILREKFLEQIKQGKNDFLLDFSNVNYIDSSGLGVLVSMEKRSKEKNGKVVLRGLSGEVKKIFELTRLTKIFEILG
jgi:anti-sigma B factor antagonist